MAVLRIAKMGNPILGKVAEPVADPSAPEIRRLAADMRRTSSRDEVYEMRGREANLLHLHGLGNLNGVLQILPQGGAL